MPSEFIKSIFLVKNGFFFFNLMHQRYFQIILNSLYDMDVLPQSIYFLTCDFVI